MTKNISIFRKIKIFRTFRKIIKENQTELENKFKLRIDGAWRLYTVLNIPEELIGEAYSLKKSDIDKISENFIKQYNLELSNFLNQKGINELFEYYEIRKVDKYSYLLVFGFSLFRSNKFYKNLYWKFLPASIVSLIIILFFIF